MDRWYFIQPLTLCPITIFDKSAEILAHLLTFAAMITGEIRSQIDADCNAFWTGGISNPLEVIEQITCLLFVRPRRSPHAGREQGGRAQAFVELMAVLARIRQSAAAA